MAFQGLLTFLLGQRIIAGKFRVDIKRIADSVFCLQPLTYTLLRNTFLLLYRYRIRTSIREVD